MTLESVQTKMQDLRNQAERARDDFATFAAEIKEHPGYTDQGKEEALEPNRMRMKERLQELRDQEISLLQRKQDDLERELFSMSSFDGANAVAYRDALSRVETIQGGGEALELFKQARMTGDSTLKQALVMKAAEFGWDNVLEAHYSASPREKEKIEALAWIRERLQGDLSRTMSYATFEAASIW